jgi:hypothetical protein
MDGRQAAAGGASRAKMMDSASNSVASDKGHTGALYSKNGAPAAEAGMALLTYDVRSFTAVCCCGAVSSGDSFDQLRDQRGQGAHYWPPFAPWVQ